MQLDAFRYPIDKRKLMLCCGCVLVVLFVVVLVWTLAGSAHKKEQVGSDALKNVPFVDGFNNLPYNLKVKSQNKLKDLNLSENMTADKTWGSGACSTCKTDFVRLRAGGIHAQFWSAGINCSSSSKDAVSQTLEQIDTIHRMVQLNNKYMFSARSAADLDNALYYDKIASFIGIDGGHSIDSRMAVLRMYYDLGVRSMSLTSECDTSWATAYNTKITSVGLNDFGKKVVAEMNRLGMIIDLSGTSYQTQIDVLKETKAPVIFSHSAAYTQVQNARNIKTDVLNQLKENKGIIMVTFEPKYACASEEKCSLTDIVAQLDEIRSKIGVENVGIGAAFDSYNGQYPTGLEDVSKYGALFDHLHSKSEPSWSINDLEKLASYNFKSVLETVGEVRNEMLGNDKDESYEALVDLTDQTCYSDLKIRYPSQEPATTQTATTQTTTTQSTTTQPSTTQTSITQTSTKKPLE